MNLTHLEYVEVPVEKLYPTFNRLTASWKPYLDTWKQMDEATVTAKDTPLYQLMLEHYTRFKKKRLESEQQLLGTHNAEADTIAEAWVRRHMGLYKSIKRQGYKPELREKPIQVRIMNDGSYRLVDGTHTVSIIKHLKISPTVEAQVVEREQGWLELKQSLYNMYGRKLLYQPVNHPDFADWEIDRESEDRWEIIKPYLDVSGKKVLDVGSNMGYFSERLTDMGAVVTGIDPNQTRVDFANILADYHEYDEDNPLYLCASFETHLRDNTYDAVLVLSLLHHYLRRGFKEFCDAVQLISEKCDKMILEVGTERMPVKWHPKLVVDNSTYTRYTVLYNGLRPIYLYEK